MWKWQIGAGGIPIAADENLNTIHESARLIRVTGAIHPELEVANRKGTKPCILRLIFQTKKYNLTLGLAQK